MNSAAEPAGIYLQKAHVEGYKSIRSCDVEFKPGLNIIIGKNGSGKTNLLDVVSLGFRTLLQTETKVKFDSYTFTVANVKTGLEVFSTVFDSKLGTNGNAISKGLTKRVFKFKSSNSSKFNEFIYPDDVRQIYEFQTSFFYHNQILGFEIPREPLLLKRPDEIFIATALYEGSRHWIYELHDDENQPSITRNLLRHLFKIVKELLGEISSFDEVVGNLDFQTQLIKDIKIGFDESCLTEKEEFRKFTPIEDFRLQGQPTFNVGTHSGELLIGQLILEFKVNGNWLSYSSLSDGTNRILFFLAECLYSYNGVEEPGPATIFIEEPELGIHPHQLHLLMTFLREQAEEKQIILTTHSPQVLDILNKDELDRIIIASHTFERGSEFRHLTDKEIAKAKKYMEELQLSDYWRLSDLEPHSY